jgi:hypothetical protein
LFDVDVYEDSVAVGYGQPFHGVVAPAGMRAIRSISKSRRACASLMSSLLPWSRAWRSVNKAVVIWVWMGKAVAIGWLDSAAEMRKPSP